MRLKHAILAAVVVQLAIPTSAVLAQSSSSKTKKTEAATDYNQLYKDAVADYNSGRYLESDAKFRQVLTKYPQHLQSQRYRAMLRKRIREQAAIPIMKKRLNGILMDEMSFEEATLAEVMEYVTRKVKEISKGKVTPGLVIRGGDAVRDRKLTFKTPKRPTDTLVDAIAKLTNTKVEYSDYALTFTPLPTAAERSAAAAKKLEQAEAKERARQAAEEAANADPFRRR